MRDGTVLRADIYRPKSRREVSGLLERTPYDKRRAWISACAALRWDTS